MATLVSFLRTTTEASSQWPTEGSKRRSAGHKDLRTSWKRCWGILPGKRRPQDAALLDGSEKPKKCAKDRGEGELVGVHGVDMYVCVCELHTTWPRGRTGHVGNSRNSKSQL